MLLVSQEGLDPMCGPNVHPQYGPNIQNIDGSSGGIQWVAQDSRFGSWFGLCLAVHEVYWILTTGHITLRRTRGTCNKASQGGYKWGCQPAYT